MAQRLYSYESITRESVELVSGEHNCTYFPKVRVRHLPEGDEYELALNFCWKVSSNLANKLKSLSYVCVILLQAVRLLSSILPPAMALVTWSPVLPVKQAICSRITLWKNSVCPEIRIAAPITKKRRVLEPLSRLPSQKSRLRICTEQSYQISS